MLYGPGHSIVFVLVVLPALAFWGVALVRLRRARDPRDRDGRRVAVDDERVRSAERLHRRALMVLIGAGILSLGLRVLV